MSASNRYRIRFASRLSAAQEQAVRQAILDGPGPGDRFDDYSRGVKQFYRSTVPDVGEVFLKVRRFDGLLKRIGRTLRPTKAEREFDHMVRLGRLAVPCPAPVAVARVSAGGLIRRSVLVQRFVADAVPLSRALCEDLWLRDALLDRLMDLLMLLRDHGAAHRDLHWDNVLVRPGDGGPELLLIDALHVHFPEPPAEAGLVLSVQWFLTFMLHRDAPADLVSAFLDRATALGPASLCDGDALLARARGVADQL